MPEESLFRGGLAFLEKIGLYDIILPFLLIFTIVFAILEKTRILGVDKVGDKTYTKKNLNAVVAFCAAFLVVASTRLVAAINEAIAHIALVLITLISFMLLVGVFFGTKELTLESYPGWMKFFMVLAFIGVVLIFLNALGWLQYIIGGIIQAYNIEWIAALILVIIIVFGIWYVAHEPKKEEKK